MIVTIVAELYSVIKSQERITVALFKSEAFSSYHRKLNVTSFYAIKVRLYCIVAMYYHLFLLLCFSLTCQTCSPKTRNKWNYHLTKIRLERLPFSQEKVSAPLWCLVAAPLCCLAPSPESWKKQMQSDYLSLTMIIMPCFLWMSTRLRQE